MWWQSRLESCSVLMLQTNHNVTTSVWFVDFEFDKRTANTAPVTKRFIHICIYKDISMSTPSGYAIQSN